MIRGTRLESLVLTNLLVQPQHPRDTGLYCQYILLADVLLYSVYSPTKQISQEYDFQ